MPAQSTTRYERLTQSYQSALKVLKEQETANRLENNAYSREALNASNIIAKESDYMQIRHDVIKVYLENPKKWDKDSLQKYYQEKLQEAVAAGDSIDAMKNDSLGREADEELTKEIEAYRISSNQLLQKYQDLTINLEDDLMALVRELKQEIAIFSEKAIEARESNLGKREALQEGLDKLLRAQKFLKKHKAFSQAIVVSEAAKEPVVVNNPQPIEPYHADEARAFLFDCAAKGNLLAVLRLTQQPLENPTAEDREVIEAQLIKSVQQLIQQRFEQMIWQRYVAFLVFYLVMTGYPDLNLSDNPLTPASLNELLAEAKTEYLAQPIRELNNEIQPMEAQLANALKTVEAEFLSIFESPLPVTEEKMVELINQAEQKLQDKVTLLATAEKTYQTCQQKSVPIQTQAVFWQRINLHELPGRFEKTQKNVRDQLTSQVFSRDIKDAEGNNLLHHCASNGQLAVFKALVMKCPELALETNQQITYPINKQDPVTGNTLLHWAISRLGDSDPLELKSDPLEDIDWLLDQRNIQCKLINKRHHGVRLRAIDQYTATGKSLLQLVSERKNCKPENDRRFRNYMEHGANPISISIHNTKPEQKIFNILGIEFGRPKQDMITFSERIKRYALVLKKTEQAQQLDELEKLGVTNLRIIEEKFCEKVREDHLEDHLRGEARGLLSYMLLVYLAVVKYLNGRVQEQVNDGWTVAKPVLMLEKAYERFKTKLDDIAQLLEKIRESLEQDNPYLLFSDVQSKTRHDHVEEVKGILGGHDLYKRLLEINKEYEKIIKIQENPLWITIREQVRLEEDNRTRAIEERMVGRMDHGFEKIRDEVKSDINRAVDKSEQNLTGKIGVLEGQLQTQSVSINDNADFMRQKFEEQRLLNVQLKRQLEDQAEAQRQQAEAQRQQAEAQRQQAEAQSKKIETLTEQNQHVIQMLQVIVAQRGNGIGISPLGAPNAVLFAPVIEVPEQQDVPVPGLAEPNND